MQIILLKETRNADVIPKSEGIILLLIFLLRENRNTDVIPNSEVIILLLIFLLKETRNADVIPNSEGYHSAVDHPAKRDSVTRFFTLDFSHSWAMGIR